LEKIRLLIIEDDDLTSSLLYEYLIDSDFSVDVVDTITNGISYIKQYNYALVLLDLNLPDFSGFELLKSMKNTISLPIIVTSAYNDTKTKVKAFKYGASDYMVKPIDLEELEARIWSLLGRYSEIKITNENSIFEIKEHKVFFQQTQLDLTTTELDILKILINNKNQTVSRDNLAESLSSISSIRSLDHHIKNIRKKIGDNGSHPKYLKTEYGLGYKLVL